MSTAAARPQVSVFDAASGEGSKLGDVALPAVLTAPIRPDVVQFVHSQVNKNKRQAYSVKDQAGMDYAAESWGTGRAVSRIPRVPGGGTHRAGQAAFGNMCRGGRRFHPTRIWRKWHRKVNLNQRRYAMCSALAASAVPSLVFARGHKIEQVPEMPLVLGGDSLASLQKTKDALAILTRFGADVDVARVKDSKRIRAGKGKMRNRRYTKKRGPLIVHASTSADLCHAFRNIEGVDLAHVDSLSLLKMAPGGHLGRFVIWTQDAFNRLDALFGTHTTKATAKTNYLMPRSMVTNANIDRIINSDEVRKVIRAVAPAPRKIVRKKNPLKNLGVMIKLNPYTVASRRAEMRRQEQNLARKAAGKKAPKKSGNTRAARQAFYQKMME
mmetsp:Transcript_4725/g.8876  ORF Transcript_4725/g.8876 Transcript_4725/m.8876 type:complete len:383 (+) Transcript_4725:47-1195(+)